MMIIIFPLTFCLIFIILAILFELTRNYLNYWKFKSVPFLKPEIFYGNSRGMGSKYHALYFMTRVYHELKDQGPIGGAFISTQPVAIITDLDLAKNVLIKDFNFFRNRGIYSNTMSDPISEHISNIEDDRWKMIRSKLTPAFTTGKLKTMMETISDHSDKLAEKIKVSSDISESVELKDILARFTCDVIGNVAFGIECNSLDKQDSDFFKMAVKSMDSFDYVMRLVFNGYRKLSKLSGIFLTPREVQDFYYQLVKKMIHHRSSENGKSRVDLLNVLIELMNNENLPFNQVAGNAFFYFVAGYETTSTSLTFCLYELATNPQIQELAREDVRQALKNHESSSSYEALQEMQYIDKVIKETLRKWPPSVSVQRETSERYHVPNTKITLDKHTPVIIPVYAIQNDPAIYEKPEVFNPSRFDKENIAKRHPLSFLSFGDGPRNCPGIRFSILEMKICLVKLLMDFRLTIDETKTKSPLEFAPDKFMICPVNGIYVHFEKLNH